MTWDAVSLLHVPHTRTLHPVVSFHTLFYHLYTIVIVLPYGPGFITVRAPGVARHARTPRTPAFPSPFATAPRLSPHTAPPPHTPQPPHYTRTPYTGTRGHTRRCFCRCLPAIHYRRVRFRPSTTVATLTTRTRDAAARRAHTPWLFRAHTQRTRNRLTHAHAHRAPIRILPPRIFYAFITCYPAVSIRVFPGLICRTCRCRETVVRRCKRFVPRPPHPHARYRPHLRFPFTCHFSANLLEGRARWVHFRACTGTRLLICGTLISYVVLTLLTFHYSFLVGGSGSPQPSRPLHSDFSMEEGGEENLHWACGMFRRRAAERRKRRRRRPLDRAEGGDVLPFYDWAAPTTLQHGELVMEGGRRHNMPFAWTLPQTNMPTRLCRTFTRGGTWHASFRDA